MTGAPSRIGCRTVEGLAALELRALCTRCAAWGHLADPGGAHLGICNRLCRDRLSRFHFPVRCLSAVSGLKSIA